MHITYQTEYFLNTEKWIHNFALKWSVFHFCNFPINLYEHKYKLPCTEEDSIKKLFSPHVKTTSVRFLLSNELPLG